MNLPAVVEVAIGLFFIYLTLSVFVSGLQESLSSILELRAKNLKDAIRNLLGEAIADQNPSDQADAQGSMALLDVLYKSPLIQGMNQKFERLRWLRFGRKTGSVGPSYISSDVFANGLLSELGLYDLSRSVSEIKLEKFIDRILYRIILNILPLDLGNDTSQAKVGTQSNAELAIPNIPVPPNVQAILAQAKQGETLKAEDIQTVINGLTQTVQGQDDSALGLARFAQLKTTLYQIEQDFRNGNASLEISISRIQTVLFQYFEEIQAKLPPDSPIVPKFNPLYKNLQQSFADEERSILINSLKPNLVETIRELKKYVDSFNNPGNSGDDQDDVKLALEQLAKKQQEDHAPEIQYLLRKLPPSLLSSLESLAERAQRKAQKAELTINEFQKEVEAWFDHSMARASGSYKRFARLLTFFLGFAIAIIGNADTFNMVSQISRDSVLRSTLVQTGITLNQQELARQNAATPSVAPPVAFPTAETPAPNPAAPPPPSNTAAIQDDINSLLQGVDDAGVTIPLGWDGGNVSQQLACPPTAAPSSANSEAGGLQLLIQGCPQQPQSGGALLGRWLSVLLGWLITAIAISLGAPFWFDLLNRLINVRDTGSRPRASTETEQRP